MQIAATPIERSSLTNFGAARARLRSCARPASGSVRAPQVRAHGARLSETAEIDRSGTVPNG